MTPTSGLRSGGGSPPERERFVDFLERVVVKKRPARHPEVLRKASPITRVRSDAPPFLVVHGIADTVIPVAQARAFVERLRGASRVGGRLPGAAGRARHGFDMTDGARTRAVVAVIGLFVDEIHRSHLLSRAKRGYIVTELSWVVTNGGV